MGPILTLNSRSSIFLDVMKDYFKLDTGRMHRNIQDLYIETVSMLREKGVQYMALKSALIPNSDKNEAAYLFDRRIIDSTWYGIEVFNAIMPILDKATTQSVKVGDLLGNNQRLIEKILNDSMVQCRNLEFIKSSDYYCLYINNLSGTRMGEIDRELKRLKAYVGFIPATKKPIARAYLSTTLMSFFLKNKSIVITSHENDRPNNENVNLGGYPFEEHGYSHLSLRELNFELFLNYKIERPVIKGFENDSEMSLSSVSECYLPIDECEIVIEGQKHQYLLREKFGRLSQAQLTHDSVDQLKEKIRDKITSNYLYNMVYLKQHDVMKFNIMLEFQRDDGGYPARLVASFHYAPANRTIRLITLH